MWQLSTKSQIELQIAKMLAGWSADLFLRYLCLLFFIMCLAGMVGVAITGMHKVARREPGRLFFVLWWFA